MRMKINRPKSILSLLIIPIGLAWLLWTPEESEKQRKERRIYPILGDINDTLSGCVLFAKMSNVWNGTFIVMLNNYKGFSIFGTTSNENYRNSIFGYFIQKGDSIYKPANTDSIFVFRGDKEYYFIFDQDINKESN